jgi:hypothetical protein
MGEGVGGERRTVSSCDAPQVNVSGQEAAISACSAAQLEP